jgi:hypothetical protein
LQHTCHTQFTTNNSQTSEPIIMSTTTVIAVLVVIAGIAMFALSMNRVASVYDAEFDKDSAPPTPPSDSAGQAENASLMV